MKRLLVFVITIVAIAGIILYKDPIVRWIDSGQDINPALLFGAAVLLALIPVVPSGIVSGILGAKYGPFAGALVNVASSTLAAALLFVSARVLFQQYARKYVSKFKRIDRFTEMMERNAFIAVLAARLIPFVPAFAVNVYSAISRIRFVTFAAATFIGKIPVMFVFAVIGDQLYSGVGNIVWTSIIYIAFVAAVAAIYWFWRKRFGGGTIV